VQRWNRRIQGKTDHDQIFRQGCIFQGNSGEVEIMDILVSQENSGKQHQSTGNMHQQVAVSGLTGAFFSAAPDQEGGRNGHQLPKNEKCQVVTGQGHTEGAGNIKQGGHVLSDFLQVQTVNATDKGNDGEDMQKDKRQPVSPAEDDFESQIVDHAKGFGQLLDQQKGDQGHGNQERLVEPHALGKRQ